MVGRLCYFILFFFTLATGLYAVRVEVSVPQGSATAGQPVQARIQVTRNEGFEVEEGSFQIDGKPLEVQHVGDSRRSSITFVNGQRRESREVDSTYVFQLDPKPSGVHVIPPIRVIVEGREYQTDLTTYTIENALASDDLKLNAGVDGRSVIYPGEHINLITTILYRENIELTFQYLPLLDAEGLRKVGEVKTRSFTRGSYHAQEYIQEVEAGTPQEYVFAPSVIEGYLYRQDFFGRRKYSQPRLRAESREVVLTVAPFPLKDRPELFDGAVGEYSIVAQLSSSSQVSVGDKMELEVTIFGSGQLRTVHLPRLSSLPGFQGAFRMSDLPPTGEVEGGAKRFVVELRPLSPEVREIPSISFSFFNPRSKTYSTVRSEAIPIVVQALPGGKELDFSSPVFQPVDQKTKEEVFVAEDRVTMNEIEEKEGIEKILISGNLPVSIEELTPHSQHPLRNIVWVLPLILMIPLQSIVKKIFWESRISEEKPRSEVLFEQAFSSLDEPRAFFGLLEKAFLLKLEERSWVDRKIHSPQDLPKTGDVGRIREFLVFMEERRFSQKANLVVQEVADEAQQLFIQIQ